MKKVIMSMAIIGAIMFTAPKANAVWDYGAINNSIKGAVQQEVKRNPDWFNDFLDYIVRNWMN